MLEAPDMTEQQKLLQWVKAWRTAGPELERQREADVQTTDTQSALAGLSDCFELARRQLSPRSDSGLVEQQRLFRKLRK